MVLLESQDGSTLELRVEVLGTVFNLIDAERELCIPSRNAPFGHRWDWMGYNPHSKMIISHLVSGSMRVKVH